ncbi:hypothetical protein [Pseudomonas quasicaspiana]|uniref:hypothetical protein n=1 Tax=Pseudomonas quasicaspiana TaxID=2829821 RepID=UPI001E46C5DC|nr:hypothetical protein [Pseudomonas quasicaspiana]MCD5972793.1 hypothetical protein [Pseudomonas quasicaspiana]
MCDVALDAYINAHDFILLDRRVESTVKSDILESTLYTQLAADNKVPSMTDYFRWRQTYLDAMTTFGWRLRTKNNYSFAPDTSVGLNVWALITNIFVRSDVARLPDAALGLAALASPLLAQMRQKERTAHISHATSIALSSRQFQVSFVSAEHILYSALVSFNTAQPLDDDPLLKSLDPTLIVGDIDAMFFSAELLDIHYELYRDAFESALVERKKTLTIRVGQQQ